MLRVEVMQGVVRVYDGDKLVDRWYAGDSLDKDLVEKGYDRLGEWSETESGLDTVQVDRV